MLSGCVLLNPTDPYAGMPVNRAYTGAPSRKACVHPFEGPLTLDEALRVALANNPDLAAAAHEVDAARAEHDDAFSERLPSLHIQGGYTRYLNDQRLIPVTGNNEPGAFSRNMASGDLVARIPLFSGGRITNRVDAAALLQESAEHRLARSREELVFNVSSVFYGMLAQRRVLESLEYSKAALKEHLKRIQDLIAARKAARVDQLRTEVRIADLDQRIVLERNVLAVQNRILANLLGLDHPGKPVEPKGDLPLTRAFIPAIEEALRLAYTTRDDYMAACAELESQAKAVDAARAGYWPTFYLFGAYGGRWAIDPSSEPAGADNPDDVGRIGLSVDIPLFEGGRIDARIRRDKARLMASRERLRKLELQIRLDVETAVLNIESALRRVEATEKTIEQAKESLRIEGEKYDLGKGTIVDVLDAQSALLESQTNYFRALADYHIAQAQWNWATGES